MGFFYGLLAAILFGANGSLTKAVMAAGMTPFQVTQFRTLATAILSGLVLLLINRQAFRITAKQFSRMALLGVVGLCMLQLTYAMAIEVLPVGIALMLEYLAVLAVAVIARVFFKEQVKARVWVAIVLVLGGIAVVSQVWTGSLDAWGLVLGLSAAACLTFYFIYGERQITATSPLTVVFWASLVGTGVTATFSGWWNLTPSSFTTVVSLQGNLDWIELPMWVPLAAVCVLGTFVPFVLSFIALGRLKPTTAGVLASSEIVFAFLVAWAWLGEALDWVQLIGAAVVLVGIVLAQTARPGAYADPDLAVASGSIPTLTGPIPRVDRTERST
jgi:drug/metabolite transporter (DMT)-like permease